MTFHTRFTTKPQWAEVYRRDVDLTDVWQEEMDPRNEFGEICTAFFTANRFEDNLRLEGVSVEGADTTLYYDRDWLNRAFGEMRIWNLEQLEMETA